MAAPTTKALQIGAQLAESLTLRCSAAALGTALAVSTSSDASGNPVIQIGAGTAGSAGGVVVVSTYSQPNSYNIIGNVAPVYAQTVVQLITEANPTGGSGADVNSLAQMQSMASQCVLTGCRVEFWQTANGTAPTTAALSTASNLKLVMEPNMFFPVVSDQ